LAGNDDSVLKCTSEYEANVPDMSLSSLGGGYSYMEGLFMIICSTFENLGEKFLGISRIV